MIVLIVGMHRSGTSMVARGLHALGANLGGPLEIKPHPANPHGHWEHAEVWRTQEDLLESFGRNWACSSGPLPAEWLDWPESLAVIERFCSIAEAELRRHGHWVVKDPRSSLLIPLWKKVAGRLSAELRVLRMYRPPQDVAASLAVRNQMSLDLAMNIWSHHHRRIDMDTEGLETETFRYDEILDQPLQQFASIARFCGLPDEFAPAAARLVEPALRHHHSDSTNSAFLSSPPTTTTRPAQAGPASSRSKRTVLIVMRTRWRMQRLPRAIRSVLAQTHRDWFLQVVNDGGPSHLVEGEIAPYRHLMEGRFGLLHFDQQRGMEAASNAGIAAAEGEFLAIHDDDDRWAPEFLERMIDFLESSDAAAAVCRSQIVEEVWNGSRYSVRARFDFGPDLDRITSTDLKSRNLFPPIALLLRRNAFQAVGAFAEELPALGDWHFNRRLVLLGPIAVWPEVLAFCHRRINQHRMPHSSRDDHLRAHEFVARWPEETPAPGLVPKAHQIRFWTNPLALADLTQWDIPGTGERALPPGLYVILLSLPVNQHFWTVRTKQGASRESLLLTSVSAAEEGSAFVLLNAIEGVSGLTIDPANGGGPVAATGTAYRLWNALPALQELAGPVRLPDVLCIGAQRSGTTWLHAALQRHKEVWSCGIKEFHMFDWDGIDPRIGSLRQAQALSIIRSNSQANPDPDCEEVIRMAVRWAFPREHSWEAYAALFESAPPGQLACDFTPAYATLDRHTVAEIAKVIPQAKIIFVLRDPVERAVSGALHRLWCDGVLQPTDDQLVRTCESLDNRLRTDYLTTLTIWKEHFLSSQILIIFHDDIVANPMGVLSKVCLFLGISPADESMLLPRQLGAEQNASNLHFHPSQLSALKARLSAGWLPMLRELEKEFGAHVEGWRLSAENMVAATTRNKHGKT